jgi:hypothetical protein
MTHADNRIPSRLFSGACDRVSGSGYVARIGDGGTMITTATKPYRPSRCWPGPPKPQAEGAAMEWSDPRRHVGAESGTQAAVVVPIVLG